MTMRSANIYALKPFRLCVLVKINTIICQLFIIISKFCAKEFTAKEPGDKNLITFPQIQRKEFIIRNPFKLSLIRIYQLTIKFICSKQKNIPIIFTIEERKSN